MRNLDRRIDIERRTVTHDDFGQEVETWNALVSRRSASMRPVSGDERVTALQWVATQQVEFQIRWSDDVADLNPLDRIIYPASEDSPAELEVYEIILVNELGRREALQIIAARRPERVETL